MKKWIQISVLSILIACVANIGYLNHKAVELKRNIYYTNARLMRTAEILLERDCLLRELTIAVQKDLSAKIFNSQKNVINAVPNVVKNVVNSVVYIEVTGKVPDPYTGELVERRYTGTGFVYDKEGHILTAGHIVGFMQEFQNPVMTVTMYNGKQFKVLQTSCLWDIQEEMGNALDLAMVKIDPHGMELVPVELGFENPALGTTLIAIGNPVGLRFSVTVGVVSRLGLSEEGMMQLLLQTDTTINPGNSGCPLFGVEGKVYGIASFMNLHYPGISFCVPVSVLNENIQKLLEELGE